MRSPGDCADRVEHGVTDGGRVHVRSATWISRTSGAAGWAAQSEDCRAAVRCQCLVRPARRAPHRSTRSRCDGGDTCVPSERHGQALRRLRAVVATGPTDRPWPGSGDRATGHGTVGRRLRGTAARPASRRGRGSTIAAGPQPTGGPRWPTTGADDRGLLPRGPHVPAVGASSWRTANAVATRRSTSGPAPTPRRSGPSRPASSSTWDTDFHTDARVGAARSPGGSSAAGSTSSYNCLDRHVEAGRGDRVAFHWEGEPGDTRTITYADLLADVQRFANVLEGLGVELGDRVVHLHADDPRDGRRHAGLHPDRRGPLAWSSAASAPTRSSTASTTPAPSSRSPPTPATAAARRSLLKPNVDVAAGRLPDGAQRRRGRPLRHRRRA